MIDPAAHNIADVLEAVGDDPVAAAQALDAERSGKDRTTLVEALERIAHPQDDTEAAQQANDTSEGRSTRSADDVEPAPLVRCRWVSVQAVDAVEQGVVLYGDEIMATAEQLADPRTPIVAWDDNWEPDPDLFHQSRLFDAPSPDEVPDEFIHNPTSGS